MMMIHPDFFLEAKEKRDASLTHVNIVSLVADIEVSVDAVLVDVGDDGHVRHAVRGPAT